MIFAVSEYLILVADGECLQAVFTGDDVDLQPLHLIAVPLSEGVTY